MANPWVQFVRKYAKEKKKSYGCAISEAGPAYRKMKDDNKQKIDENNKEIKELELELRAHKALYDEYTTHIGDRRPAPSKVKYAKMSLKDYNRVKEKLEKISGNKYEELKSFSDQIKEVNKLSKKDMEQDRLKYGPIDLSKDKINWDAVKSPYKKGRVKMLF